MLIDFEKDIFDDKKGLIGMPSSAINHDTLLSVLLLPVLTVTPMKVIIVVTIKPVWLFT